MNLSKRLLHFGFISALGLTLDVLLFLILIEISFSPGVANFVSASTAVTFVFFASVWRVFYYRGQFVLGLLVAYWCYQAIAVFLASWAVSALSVHLLVPLAAKFAILPVTFLANYIFMSHLTGRRSERPVSGG